MKTLINLYHLKYFCDAALHTSISEASKINYISQSAVSQAIAKLEITLKVPLLVRSHQKFQLTEEGKIIFEHASSIFKMVQEIQDKVSVGQESIAGNLKIVTTHSVGMSFIAPLFLKMKERYPQVEIQCHMGNLNFIRNALRQRDAEFAIAVYEEDSAHLTKKVIKRGLFNLYQHEDASPEQIENGLLIDFPTSLYVEEIIEHFFHSNFIPLKILQALSSWEAVARFVELNIGVGLIPDYLIDSNRYPKVKKYPIELPEYPYEICAVYNKGDKLSRVANAFLELFEEV